MNKTRVLIKTSLGYNGISSIIMNYYQIIDKNKFIIDFLTSEKTTEVRNDYIEIIQKYGGRIYYTGKVNHLFKYISITSKVMKMNLYDVIHVNGSSANMLIDILLAFIFRIKTRISHSHNTNCNNKLTHFIFKPFLNIFTTKKVACGYDAGKWTFYGKFTVIRNGINFNDFYLSITNRERIRNKYSIDESIILILHVGVFNEQKNHSKLIAIFNEIIKISPLYRLMLVGDGYLHENIKKMVIDKGLDEKIIFTGSVPNINEYYSAADLFVLPSLYEGLPVVLIEAQVNGLPCVISSQITEESIISKKVISLDVKDTSYKWAYTIDDFYKCHNRKFEDLINSARDFDIYNNLSVIEAMYEH